MSFPIVVIHSMSKHEVVVDDLWVLEGGRLPHSTFFPILLCLLPIVMIIGPIHGHEQHDVIWFFHGIDMKQDIVKCPCPGVCITHIFVIKRVLDVVTLYIFGPVMPLFDQSTGKCRHCQGWPPPQSNMS